MKTPATTVTVVLFEMVEKRIGLYVSRPPSIWCVPLLCQQRRLPAAIV